MVIKTIDYDNDFQYDWGCIQDSRHKIKNYIIFYENKFLFFMFQYLCIYYIYEYIFNM